MGAPLTVRWPPDDPRARIEEMLRIEMARLKNMRPDHPRRRNIVDNIRALDAELDAFNDGRAT